MQKGIIGIFDSGLGGLSIAREVRKILPSEDILYVGDCGNAPYGDQPEAFVIERVLKISDFSSNIMPKPSSWPAIPQQLPL